MNNIFLNGLLPSINVPNWNVPKARAMKRGQSANLSTKQNILLDGTFAKTNSGKVYQSVTTQLQKTSDFTSLVATISILNDSECLWYCWNERALVALNDETKMTETEIFFQDQIFWNRNFFSKTKFSETETGHRSQSKPIGYFLNHGTTKEQMKIEKNLAH